MTDHTAELEAGARRRAPAVPGRRAGAPDRRRQLGHPRPLAGLRLLRRLQAGRLLAGACRPSCATRPATAIAGAPAGAPLPPQPSASHRAPDDGLRRRRRDPRALRALPDGRAADGRRGPEAPGLVVAEAEGGRGEAAGGGRRRRHVGAAGRHPAASRPASPSPSSRRTPTSAAPGSRTAIPDCRVDNPSHLYSYSFEPNHEWPNHFSPQPVLLAYFQNVADKHGLRAHIRFETAGRGGRVRRGRRHLEGPRQGQGRQGRDPDRQGGDLRRRPAEPAAPARTSPDATTSRARRSTPPAGATTST